MCSVNRRMILSATSRQSCRSIDRSIAKRIAADPKIAAFRDAIESGRLIDHVADSIAAAASITPAVFEPSEGGRGGAASRRVHRSGRSSQARFVSRTPFVQIDGYPAVPAIDRPLSDSTW